MILEGTEIYWFDQIHFILEVKWGHDPKTIIKNWQHYKMAVFYTWLVHQELSKELSQKNKIPPIAFPLFSLFLLIFHYVTLYKDLI